MPFPAWYLYFWLQLWNQLSSPVVMFSTKSLLSGPCLPGSSLKAHICAHFSLPVNKWRTQRKHAFQYPSQSQHHLLQHTVFSSKLCCNFSVMFDELIIFMPVDLCQQFLFRCCRTDHRCLGFHA